MIFRPSRLIASCSDSAPRSRVRALSCSTSIVQACGGPSWRFHGNRAAKIGVAQGAAGVVEDAEAGLDQELIQAANQRRRVGGQGEAAVGDLRQAGEIPDGRRAFLLGNAETDNIDADAMIGVGIFHFVERRRRFRRRIELVVHAVGDHDHAMFGMRVLGAEILQCLHERRGRSGFLPTA